jgi:hypothetical protein
MSIQAMAEVWGAEVTPAQAYVLLAVADVVNDAYGNEFWMASGALAKKVGMLPGNARHRLAELVELGWIEVLEIVPGEATRYRWLGSRRENATPRSLDAGGASRERTPLLSPSTQVIPSGTQSLAPAQKFEPIIVDGFDAFWAHYPRKKGKGAARTAWARATKKADPGEIITGLSRYCREVEQVDEARFIAHPATWLNQERWLDEPDQDPTNVMLARMVAEERSRPEILELNP